MNIYNCLSFAAGISCGVAAGMLVAPLSGTGLRKEMAGRVEDAANEAIGEVRSAIQRRVAVVDHTIKGGVAAFHDASDVYLHS